MSIRDAYEACLIELNKVQAPSLLLDDFVYLFNKAIQQYVNIKYNLFEANQQSTDDLRLLTKTCVEHPTLTSSENTFGESYDCLLPEDYVHILNVICEFTDGTIKRCNNGKNKIVVGANKLDSNKWPSVISNYYMKPSVRQPYYYIINLESPGDIMDSQDKKKITDISERNKKAKTDDRDGIRYGNSKQPIMQIKCGNLGSKYTLDAVYIDYLRAPKYVYLDQDLLDQIEDKSQILEFSDYVVYEIINIFIRLALENAKDPRIQTFPSINTTIPIQQAQLK